jgi:hypothetical protein
LTPDMIVREVTNGWWFIATLELSILFLWFSIVSISRNGWEPVYAAAAAIGCFLMAKAIIRIWVWGFLWQVDHGYQPTLRDDYWAALVSVIFGIPCLAYIIFRLTPTRLGHWPWVVLTCVSIAVPIFALFYPWAPQWPPALDILKLELLDLLRMG